MNNQKLMAKLLVIQSLLNDINKENLTKETRLVISAIEERVRWIVKNLSTKKPKLVRQKFIYKFN